MKRLLAILATVVLWATSAEAQNIILGEKVPDSKIRSWLMDLQPDAADYTCILFHNSKSPQCKKHLPKIKQMVNDYGSKLNLIIVTKEDYSKAGVSLTEHLDDRIGVAFDDGGRTFIAYGVKFIPFCVIYDKKGYALWCGHAGSFTKEIFDRILTYKRK